MVERLGDARPLLGLVRASSRRACCSRSISDSWRAAILARRSSSALRGDEVLRVRAAVLDELALVEVQHARDRLVEQREVVADHEQRAAVRAQELHQPLLGVDVEVVRRLVEQQQVAAREQDARELDAPALTTGQRADREVEAVGARARARRRCAAPPTRPRSRPRCGTRPRRCRNALHVARRRVGVDLRRAAPRAGAPRRRGRGPTARARARCRRARRRAAAGPAGGSRPRRARARRPRGRRARPASTFSSEVLPAPLRPTRPTLSPACSENERVGRA